MAMFIFLFKIVIIQLILDIDSLSHTVDINLLSKKPFHNSTGFILQGGPKVGIEHHTLLFYILYTKLWPTLYIVTVCKIVKRQKDQKITFFKICFFILVLKILGSLIIETLKEYL